MFGGVETVAAAAVVKSLSFLRLTWLRIEDDMII